MLHTSDSAGKTFLSGVRGWSADTGVFSIGIYTFSGLVRSQLGESLGNILFLRQGQHSEKRGVKKMRTCSFTFPLNCDWRSMIGVSSFLSSFRGLQCCWHCTDMQKKLLIFKHKCWPWHKEKLKQFSTPHKTSSEPGVISSAS